MRPYYVFTPVLRVDHFDLHVRFGPDKPPGRVFRVADAFDRDLDEPRATATRSSRTAAARSSSSSRTSPRARLRRWD